MNLKLARLAVITIPSEPNRLPDYFCDGNEVDFEVEIYGTYKSENNLSIVFAVSTELEANPEIDANDLVVVPAKERKECERVIENIANVIAVGEMCKRAISSPHPCAAFVSSNQETIDWLNKYNGIAFNYRTLNSFHLRIDPAKLYILSQDRPAGVALLAEALAQEHPTGRFHECIRLFELAFGLATRPLVRPLSEFLSNAPQQYERDEVEYWIETVRHQATHADLRRQQHFLLESEVRPVMNRLMEATYDVLFNKKIWHDSSPERRELWQPEAFIQSRDGNHRVIINPLPKHWWCKIAGENM